MSVFVHRVLSGFRGVKHRRTRQPRNLSLFLPVVFVWLLPTGAPAQQAGDRARKAVASRAETAITAQLKRDIPLAIFYDPRVLAPDAPVSVGTVDVLKRYFTRPDDVITYYTENPAGFDHDPTRNCMPADSAPLFSGRRREKS